MQGSLDQPPIVLTANRKLLMLAIAGGICFAILGFWVLTLPIATLKATIAGVGCVMGGAAGVIIGFVKIARPDQLELSPSGLRFRSVVHHGFDLPWEDVCGFRLWRIGGSACVIFDISDRARPTVRISSRNRDLTGADIGLPTAWSVDPEEMVSLLTDARTRWVGAVC